MIDLHKNEIEHLLSSLRSASSNTQSQIRPDQINHVLIHFVHLFQYQTQIEPGSSHIEIKPTIPEQLAKSDIKKEDLIHLQKIIAAHQEKLNQYHINPRLQERLFNQMAVSIANKTDDQKSTKKSSSGTHSFWTQPDKTDHKTTSWLPLRRNK